MNDQTKTSNLILDHLFCFCEPPAKREVEIAERAGFALTAGTRHQGQGTANRCIVFEENYRTPCFDGYMSNFI